MPFPTDLTFFAHHVIGILIVFGIWSMVLKEAKLLSARSETKTTISFWWVTGLSIATMEGSSFFYCLYSMVNFGSILKLSLFAAFTYSHVLSITCVLSQHPWGASVKAIWSEGHLVGRSRSSSAQAAMARLPLLERLRSRKFVSANYLYMSFMVAVLCLVRHNIMWDTVKEETSGVAAIVVGNICALLAAGCVWRMRDFKE